TSRRSTARTRATWIRRSRAPRSSKRCTPRPTRCSRRRPTPRRRRTQRKNSYGRPRRRDDLAGLGLGHARAGGRASRRDPRNLAASGGRLDRPHLRYAEGMTLLHDLRVGLRILRRSRGTSLVAVITLALGIGGATAMFTLLDAVVLRPLPYPPPDRLPPPPPPRPPPPPPHPPPPAPPL